MKVTLLRDKFNGNDKPYITAGTVIEVEEDEARELIAVQSARPTTAEDEAGTDVADPAENTAQPKQDDLTGLPPDMVV
jgi:hypothetical protein